MKKKLIIILFALFFVQISYCQKDTILYIFPDNVEEKFNNYISKFLEKNPEYNFYFIVNKNDSTNYKVSIAPYKNESNSLTWFLLSNRFVIISDSYYPVIFDYDFRFATTDKKNIGEYKNREGKIRRIAYTSSFFYVIFNYDGEIIEN